MKTSSIVLDTNPQGTTPAAPNWLNKGDNAWQMVSATLVAMQGMPALVILYAGLVKKKWALNSALMTLYAFAAVMPCWILWAYNMSFGHRLFPFWGKPGVAVSQDFLIQQAFLPSTGYKNITPATQPCLVQGWAALVMGIASGTIPWYSMMCLSKKLPFLQKVDDSLGVFHSHGVAGILGGALTGLFAHPQLCNLFLPIPDSNGAFYGGSGGVQFVKQLVGVGFIVGWNVVVTSIILLVIRAFIPLRMTEEELKIGDHAAHGETAYELTVPT